MTGAGLQDGLPLISPGEVRENLLVDFDRIAASVALLEQIPVILHELEARLGRRSALSTFTDRLVGSNWRLSRHYRRAAVELTEIARDLHGTIDALDERKVFIAESERRIGGAVSALEAHAETLIHFLSESPDIDRALPAIPTVAEEAMKERLEGVLATVLTFLNIQRSETSPALLLVAEMRQQIGRVISECRGFALGGCKATFTDSDSVSQAVVNPHLKADLRLNVETFTDRVAEIVAEFRATLDKYDAVSRSGGTSA